MNKKLGVMLVGLGIISMLVGCANESYRELDVKKVASYNTSYHGKRVKLAVGKFNNQSTYLNGIFSDGVDHIGNQAKNILVTHLQQTNRFNVLERDNLVEMSVESGLANKKPKIQGAPYIVTGYVTDFGRKVVGDKQLFGILGSGKSQIAYAKINLNVVNTDTSEVVYSTQGSGEYELSHREIAGFGGAAAYDSTLNGKVLDLALRSAINSMVNDIENEAWKLKL